MENSGNFNVTSGNVCENAANLQVLYIATAAIRFFQIYAASKTWLPVHLFWK